MIFGLGNPFSFSGTIDRGPYAVWGLILFAVKYNLDRWVAVAHFNRSWGILNYLNPSERYGVDDIPRDQAAFYATLLAMALPFIWVGVAMTLRRLRSADLPLWLVILFFVPVVNIFLFILLSLMPSRLGESYRRLPSRMGFQDLLDWVIPDHPVGSAAVGLLVTTPLAVGVTLLSVNGFENYGWGLFVGLPFCVGFTSVLIYGYHRPRPLGTSIAVAFLSIILVGLALLAVAVEGIICLMMAAPLAAAVAIFGGLIGYLIQCGPRRSISRPAAFSLLFLAAPAFVGVESVNQTEPRLLEAKSTVVINAPPERVWPKVVEFSELPPPEELLFKTGVAYPIRAEIKGRGAGAVRHCVFSTGAFVEPIEVWDEPRLLKFSVAGQPPPMYELTPYSGIRPTHLDRYMSSEAGQFLLVRLPDGRTRLEGTTWYRNRFWPEWYWQAWSDHIIHRIHLRVLNHIKLLAEQDVDR
ncbi:MAG TPA: DUF805 domain-containing protein [Blastocatellia bacterium]|nr:DUF805 domain-containing protein [Blastocatellia bacterium]